MRTVFGYRNLAAWESCEHCGKDLPLGPFSIFGGGVHFATTTCPSCGQVDTVREHRAGGVLSSGADTSTLSELAETPDDVRTERTRTKIKEQRGVSKSDHRVGGEVICPGCEQPLWLPLELQDRAPAVVRCHGCSREVHLLPPPGWLPTYFPTLSHVVTLEPPPSFPCPRCQAPIYVERGPAEVRCGSCRGKVEVPEAARGPAIDPAAAARPFYARLHLTPAALRQSHPPLGVYFGSVLLAPAAAIIVLGAIGWAPVALALLSGLLVLPIGLLIVALSLRNRRRRRDYIARVERAERERLAVGACGDRPYR